MNHGAPLGTRLSLGASIVGVWAPRAQGQNSAGPRSLAGVAPSACIISQVDTHEEKQGRHPGHWSPALSTVGDTHPCPSQRCGPGPGLGRLGGPSAHVAGTLIWRVPEVSLPDRAQAAQRPSERLNARRGL
jgi:hypothetical protein